MSQPELARGARITGEQRTQLSEQVAQRYGSGESIRAIAADLGRSYGWVQTLLKEAGVQLRRRGGDTRSPSARAASSGQVRSSEQDTSGTKDKKKDKSEKAEKKAKDKKSKGKKSKDDKGKNSKGKNKKGKKAKK